MLSGGGRISALVAHLDQKRVDVIDLTRTVGGGEFSEQNTEIKRDRGEHRIRLPRGSRRDSVIDRPHVRGRQRGEVFQRAQVII